MAQDQWLRPEYPCRSARQWREFGAYRCANGELSCLVVKPTKRFGLLAFACMNTFESVAPKCVQWFRCHFYSSCKIKMEPMIIIVIFLFLVPPSRRFFPHCAYTFPPVAAASVSASRALPQKGRQGLPFGTTMKADIRGFEKKNCVCFTHWAVRNLSSLTQGRRVCFDRPHRDEK